MPWRWGWPPWESRRVQADRQRALDAIERATVDLGEARTAVQRTARVADSLREAYRRNHFSESMEQLFTTRPARSAHHPKG